MWQGLLVLDDALKIRYANGAAAVFLRAKRESVVDTPDRRTPERRCRS
jgi:hypothetical protein